MRCVVCQASPGVSLSYSAPGRRNVWQNSHLNRGAADGVSSGDMRNLGSRSALLGLGSVAFLAAAPAYADDSVAGAYEAKFEQVANNCEHPIAYPARGWIKIEIKG